MPGWNDVPGKRPCPFCGEKFHPTEANQVTLGDSDSEGHYHRCPHCQRLVVYGLEIYPGKDWRWGKPANVVQDLGAG